MRSEPRASIIMRMRIYVLSSFALFLLLLWLLRWPHFFAFSFSESPAVGFVQHSTPPHLALPNAQSPRCTVRFSLVSKPRRSHRAVRLSQVSKPRRPRRAILRLLLNLHHQTQPNSRSQPSCIIASYACACQLTTFLIVTDMYIHAYIMRIDPSFRASRYCARQLSDRPCITPQTDIDAE